MNGRLQILILLLLFQFAHGGAFRIIAGNKLTIVRFQIAVQLVSTSVGTLGPIQLLARNNLFIKLCYVTRCCVWHYAVLSILL